MQRAAAKAGVSPRTVYRRLADPAFDKQLKAARGELLRRPAGVLTAGWLEAVKTLLELQKAGSPPNVRLGAARSVVELGMQVRESEHFEKRLALLEEHMDTKKRGGRGQAWG